MWYAISVDSDHHQSTLFFRKAQVLILTANERNPDYYCQYPRWNLQVQGAPLSVYVMRRVKTNLTAYIISHKMGDSTVHALQQILKAGVSKFNMGSNPSAYLANPFEIAVLLSSLSFEASKYHMSRFRRYMWEQVRWPFIFSHGMICSPDNWLKQTKTR